MEDNLNALSRKMLGFYSRNKHIGSRLGGLRFENFTDPGKPHTAFPELSCKAAQARYLVPFGVELSRDPNLNSGSDHDMALLYALEHMQGFYDKMLVGPNFLSAATSAAMIDDAEKFLAFYTFLANHSAEHGILRFGYKPKHHYFYHMSTDAVRMNPRLGWTYADEDRQ